MHQRKICFLVFILIVIRSLPVCAQQNNKALIDTSAFDRWPSMGHEAISNDGKYFCYAEQQNNKSHLYLRSTVSPWKIDLGTRIKLSQVLFTRNSRSLVFQSNDTVYRYDIRSRTTHTKSGINNFQLVEGANNKEWLFYRVLNDLKALIISPSDDVAKTRQVFADKFWIAQQRLIYTEQSAGNKDWQLKWMDLINNKSGIIWQGHKINSLSVSPNSDELAFVAGSDDVGSGAVIWYTRDVKEGPKIVLSNRSDGFEQGWLIADVQNVTDDGRIYFNINKTANAPIGKTPNVNLWKYTDARLNWDQKRADFIAKNQSYLCEVNVHNGQIHLLEQSLGDKMLHQHGDGKINDDQPVSNILIHSGLGNEDEWNWNTGAMKSIFCIDPKNENCRLIQDSLIMAGDPFFTWDKSYVIFFNYRLSGFFSYQLCTGTLINLTAKNRVPWRYVEDYQGSKVPSRESGTCIPIAHTSDFLVATGFDIYRVDASGIKPSVNITRGLGQSKQLWFDFIFTEAIDPGKPLIVSAASYENRHTGFYQIDVSGAKPPAELNMASFSYKSIEKARDAEVFIVRRENAESFPNWFITKDFRSFQSLTDFHPERAYNWLTTELINIPAADGKTIKGLLYKPENFDPAKRYPIIFNYYETKTTDIDQFQQPEFFGSEINIPYFVSHGYLVFTPDNHFELGHPGEGALNTITTSAKYLSKMPWVDSTKMGLQGHSFGGFQTLYVITHSHLFAAAMAGSPMSDFVSAYGSLIGGGVSRQMQYELYRDRIGATLWESPDLYIENSPVLKIGNVTTPLLMMSNDKDGDVPFSQGIEFFTGMRRAQKPCWLLQYPGAGHNVDGENAKDYTVRVKEFFDHYLKGAPMPDWMKPTQGQSIHELNDSK